MDRLGSALIQATDAKEAGKVQGKKGRVRLGCSQQARPDAAMRLASPFPPGCGAMARLLWRRLQGFTGDGLGVTQQVCEVAFYLGLAVALPA